MLLEVISSCFGSERNGESNLQLDSRRLPEQIEGFRTPENEEEYLSMDSRRFPEQIEGFRTPENEEEDLRLDSRRLPERIEGFRTPENEEEYLSLDSRRLLELRARRRLLEQTEGFRTPENEEDLRLDSRRLPERIEGFRTLENEAQQYLRLSCESVERVQNLLVSSRLHINQLQCRLLADALSEAVQSAKQDIQGLDPPAVRLCAPAFRELCHVAWDCEKLVRHGCKKNWLAIAILLADSREDFLLRVSELKWCTKAWRTVIRYGLLGGAWLEQFHKSSQTSMANRSTDMDTVSASLEIAFEADLRILISGLTEIQGDVDRDEHERDFAAYALKRCEMIASERPDSKQDNTKHKLWCPCAAASIQDNTKHKLWCPCAAASIPNSRHLGSGEFGAVRGVLYCGEQFAAKMKHSSNDGFDKEMVVMAKISSHPRLVRFLGALTLPYPTFFGYMIVMELMSSNLEDYMRERWPKIAGGDTGGGNRSGSTSGSAPFPLHVAVDVMLQIAEGVEVLHKHRLVHRDLKARNVLVEPVELEPFASRKHGYVRVKLAGFSLTEPYRSRTFECKNIGSRKWMAPELQPESPDTLQIFPTKADTFSFAILCSEILSGTAPYPNFLGMREYVKFVQKGLRPKLPAALPSRLSSLIQNCWDEDPIKRPTFTSICKELRYIKFLLTIGGEMQYRALDHPNEDMHMTAEIMKHFWIDHRELHLKRHVRSGGYGSVDMCLWQGKQVAVKNLIKVSTRKRVEEEAALLLRVQHLNVVKLLGCAFNEEEKKGMIVMELMEQDLHRLISNIRLFSPQEPPFSLHVAVEIMLKIATAMSHIRSCNVLHRGLKTTNILVNARAGSQSSSPSGVYYDVKLADFGLSKYKEVDSTFTTKPSEAQLWRAPETSHNYSWPADVFSFGVVCYEILSGEVPFRGLQGPELSKLVLDGKRPEIPAYCPSTVAELVSSCWATRPEDRPDFAEICSSLEACLKRAKESLSSTLGERKLRINELRGSIEEDPLRKVKRNRLV